MSRSLVGWAGSLCVALVGCGGESSNATAGKAGSSSGGASDAGSAGAATEAGAGNTSGGSRGEAGASAGAENGGGGAGGSGPVPLVPLVPGHVLTFTAITIDPAQPLPGGPCVPLEAKLEEPLSVQGHSGIGYHGPCSTDAFLIEGSGDQLTAHQIQDGGIVRSYDYIHSPVADGETWLINGITQTWHPAPAAVETPAGTFSDCWIRVGEDLRITYCRGVGLVDLWDAVNNYDLQLASKNF